MLNGHVRKIFSRFLLLGVLIVTLSIGIGIIKSPQAIAAIRRLEEAPGQVVYQSRQTLKDQKGNPWQVIAFKRINPQGKTAIELRLVGFPGQGKIARNQALLLTNSLGKTLTAEDVSQNIFTDANQPEPHIGQYNIQPLLPELQAEIPLQLTLPTLESNPIHLSIPSSFVQEWLAL